MNQNVTDVITRHDMVRIDFSCYQTQPDILTKAFTIINNDYKGVVVSGPWTYTLYMEAYIDDGCTTLVDTNTPIKLNQQVWVKLSTTGLNRDVVVLVTDHCWATDQPSPMEGNKLDLIEKGCPKDPTVVMKENGRETFNKFAFNMFEFSEGSTQIYLHCEVSLCVKSTNTCEPNCPINRRRRSLRSKHDSPGLISMGWTS
ncbi:pancreatic secretory granule membrane major glycoprotein GP2 [Austrofundulus limnaeus]|uniref:Pancreatic secretory granule membrane major glycoprotein GP2 n=1 Tax=Austrofundulus limnaeus TaxID=52670 RepID=A0A2I4D1C5_AUSLI|nr:PREDICTED: pancreatic secretory granule membrane major glycoprotein GP2-like [Austrofundulus limnaeus]